VREDNLHINNNWNFNELEISIIARKCQDKWNKVYNEHRLCPKLELISIG
jgi:hypothetical protein